MRRLARAVIVTVLATGTAYYLASRWRLVRPGSEEERKGPISASPDEEGLPEKVRDDLLSELSRQL